MTRSDSQAPSQSSQEFSTQLPVFRLPGEFIARSKELLAWIHHRTVEWTGLLLRRMASLTRDTLIEAGLPPMGTASTFSVFSQISRMRNRRIKASISLRLGASASGSSLIIVKGGSGKRCLNSIKQRAASSRREP